MSDDPLEWAKKVLSGEIPTVPEHEAKRYCEENRFKGYGALMLDRPRLAMKMFIDLEPYLSEYGIEDRERIAAMSLMLQAAREIWDWEREQVSKPG